MVTKRFLPLIVLLALGFSADAQITITPNLTAQQLVNRLVGSNVTVLNPVLNCPNLHNGEFTTGMGNNLGLSGGIILATGTASSLEGPHGGFVDQNQQTPGDSALSGLINDLPTNDACILEFDFLPDVDSQSTLRFQYVFGSEEYPGFTCSPFNDVFGFLLTGPGYQPAVNIALVPGTTIPVAINSVNSGVASGGYQLSTCQAMGPGSPFPAYFVNNQQLNGQTITLDGFTTVLEATAIVHPCDTYHMKLGIANASDHALQSAVFLQEKSFTVDTVTLDLSGIIQSDDGYLVEGCTPGLIRAVRTQSSPQKKKICLSFGGSAVNGLDYPLLPDSLVIPAGGTFASMILTPLQDNFDEPGYETVIIRRLDCCTKMPIDSIEIKIRDSLKMDILSKDTSICGGSGVVTLHATGDPAFTYAWTPTTAVVNPNDTLTTATPTTTTTYTVTATYGGCPPVSRSFTAFVEPIPIISIWPKDTAFCLADPYPIMATVEPPFANYIFNWSPTTGLDNPNSLAPEFYTQTPGTYNFVLTVSTPIGCMDQDSATITVRPAVVLTDVTEDFTIKYGDSKQLNASGATYYTWTPDRLLDYPNEHNPTAGGWAPETFQVIGTDQWGCRDTAYVKMNIDYTMFEWLPNAFSPNGDGRNDVFSIRNMKFQRLIEFRVFNRWGQEVFTTTDMTRGWDGTFKGEPQEIGVYHYIIRVTTPDGQQRSYQGDVSLIR